MKLDEDIMIEPSVSTDGVIPVGDDDLYFDPVLKTAYYNYYFSYGRHFRPRSIFEIGVRAGYTAYYMMLGAGGATTKYRGIDLETYLHSSNSAATARLSKLCPDVEVMLGDSHGLLRLDAEYDLVHVDGDHSYDGKLLDLALAFSGLADGGVVVVDDCSPLGEKANVHRAVLDFVRRSGVAMRWYHPLCGSALNPTDGHAILWRPFSQASG